MSVYSRPVMFLLLAVVVISVGTLITTFIPLLAGTTYQKIEGVKPYTALELAGRDVYIREGCNNCHTQTVRPLKFETDRYGEYSRGGESAYDRPFQWGSKRTGPDLAREGGKYPDAWHYEHFRDPRALAPQSNMPAYAFLADARLDPAYAERKMNTLGFPYTKEEISGLADKTEMDAIVAYMQKLGADFKKLAAATAAAPASAATAPPGEPATNPFAGNTAAIKEGEEIYEANCSPCHGTDLTGGIGPNLVDEEWIFGSSDADLYETVTKGRPGGMPPFESSLGSERVWKVIAFVKSDHAHRHEQAEGH